MILVLVLGGLGSELRVKVRVSKLGGELLHQHPKSYQLNPQAHGTPTKLHGIRS